MATPSEERSALRSHFLEYDATRGVFRLTCSPSVASQASSAESASVWREIGDFQALDRAVHRLQKTDASSSSSSSSSAACVVPRLSLRRLKKLTASSWLRGDTARGWRPELQKNVAFCEQWLDAALAQASSSDSQRFVDDDVHHAHQRTRRKTQHAKQLQQYFTGASLVQLVVQRLPELLTNLGLEPLHSDRVVWLEPSCGDARIVRALVTAGASRVVGYELDEAVYATAVASCEGTHGVTLTQGDFLATSPPSETETVNVMALGNPPFGSDAVDDSDRDLVDKFLLHVALVWRAQLVAFIVPARCARPDYVARLLQKLDAGERAVASSQGSKRRQWIMELCEPLDDCTFEFQTTKRVKQPSAFVVFVSKPKPSDK